MLVSLGEQSMFANVEVLEHAGDDRFVAVARERDAVQQDAAGEEHASTRTKTPLTSASNRSPTPGHSRL